MDSNEHRKLLEAEIIKAFDRIHDYPGKYSPDEPLVQVMVSTILLRADAYAIAYGGESVHHVLDSYVALTGCAAR